jgi:hypothetical protein
MNKGIFTVLAAGLLMGTSMPAHTWANTIGETKTAVMENRAAETNEQQRLTMLELAVQPQSADSAIELFVKSYQIRNGALLYAIMTPEERTRRLQQFAEQNWVLGGSSPWIRSYRTERTYEKGNDVTEYHLQLLEYTSLGFMGIEKVIVTVKKQGEYWLIDNHTPVTFETNMDVMSEKLSHETVLGLVAEAQRRYWYMASGGDGRNMSRFIPADTETTYRWLSEDIGTRENLISYLQDIFSTAAVSAYIDKQFSGKKLIEEDGRLAQPDADSGSLRDWGHAKLESLKQDGRMAKATLSVPVGDDGHETYEIQFV